LIRVKIPKAENPELAGLSVDGKIVSAGLSADNGALLDEDIAGLCNAKEEKEERDSFAAAPA
jgi:hypothetical protein